MNLTEASRPIMWNISAAWLMYVLFAAAMGAFIFGLHRRISGWKRGRADDERLSDWGRRFVVMLRELLMQRRVRNSRLPAVFHSFIFYSFIFLVITTTVVALDYDFGTSLFKGWFYVFLTIGCELAGVFLLIGAGIALWRRLVSRPETLETKPADIFAIALVGLLAFTGFLTEGLRIAVLGDEWQWLSPVGLAFSLPFAGISEETGAGIHKGLWWVHTAFAMGWIGLIPYTKFFHMISLPTNVFFSKLENAGTLKRVDIEEMMCADDFDEENFQLGIENTRDLTWKQRMDFDACIECGRCEEVCPAVLAGHPFSPKDFILSCRRLVEEQDDVPVSQQTTDGMKPIVGGALHEEFVWYCRTCMACMEVCPACIDHVDSMVEVRRNEVMMQARMPLDAKRALKTLENMGNPFGPQGDRVDWIKELGVPVIGAGESCDVIYWVGCCTTFDPTKQQIARDLCTLLQRCGIEFGVLGKDERCCGDPARLLGEERLFQEIAKAQVEEIKKRDFRILLTSCPHCYNVLKNEYPQFGGDFEVVHHTEFIHEMLWTGDLQPAYPATGRYVFHDPCYLGRYQKQYEAPREALRSLDGAEVTEMKNHHERSLCCGGGGGHFWMDLKKGERINNLRVKQAQDEGADTIVTGCAYCMQMLNDSVKIMEADDNIRVTDIATLMLNTLPEVQDEAPSPAKDNEPPANTAKKAS